MVRLGLSDSMRSTVSIENTEPLHTASHRRPPRRPRAASTAPSTDAPSEQQTQSKASSFVLSNLLRILLGGLLAITLLSTGVKMVNLTVRISQTSNARTGAQFERLERSFEQLGRDTTRLQTTADSFLQSCQDAQVAASTRTRMLQSMAKSRFDEQTKAHIEEHEHVMKEVLQYYAQQEQQVLEARERLLKMNVTLPIQIDTRNSLAMEGLPLFAEKTLQQEGDDYQRSRLESVSIQRTEQPANSNRQTRAEQSGAYGSFLFYTVVVCAYAVYLWNAVSDKKKKELLEDKWAWSPVPKVLTRLKTLLGSVVVIEDSLRTPNNKDDEAYSPNQIEHIEVS